MGDLIGEFEVDFACIRKRKNDFLFYVGEGGHLYDTILPISSIRHHHISNVFESKPDLLRINISAVDDEKKAHLFVTQLDKQKGKIDLLKHYILDDARYEKVFTHCIHDGKQGKLIIAGERETEKRSKNYGELFRKVINDYINLSDKINHTHSFNVKKGSVRFVAYYSIFGSCLLFSKRASGKKSEIKLFSLSEDLPLTRSGVKDFLSHVEVAHKIRDIETLAAVGQASSHIKVGETYSSVIPGDNAIIFILRGGRFTLLPYPSGVKASDIIKITAKPRFSEGLFETSILLLTKDGKLWGYGRNSYNMLSDDPNIHVTTDWIVVHENVEDVHQVHDFAEGILIKTKDGKLYYRGHDERDNFTNEDMCFIPSIKKNVYPNMNLVEENIDTYIGASQYQDEKATIWYSYFLNNNGDYIKGQAYSSDASKDCLYIWMGDAKKMIDSFFESIKHPSILLDYLCKST